MYNYDSTWIDSNSCCWDQQASYSSQIECQHHLLLSPTTITACSRYFAGGGALQLRECPANAGSVWYYIWLLAHKPNDWKSLACSQATCSWASPSQIRSTKNKTFTHSMVQAWVGQKTLNDHGVCWGNTGWILARSRRSVASRVALDLLYWAMRSALHRLICMDIEMTHEACACFSFVDIMSCITIANRPCYGPLKIKPLFYCSLICY